VKTKLILILLILLSSFAIADIASDEKVSFWDYFVIPEQSVFETAVESNRITKDDSLTIKVSYQTKFDNVEDYKIDFSFITPEGVLLEQGFYTYHPNKALEKGEKHALTLTVSTSIKTLYNNHKEQICNRYLGIIGKLYVKTPEGWKVDRFGETSDIHLFEKFLFYCPDIEPPKGCDVEWIDEPECVDDYHVRQNQILSDCRKVFQLIETCNKAEGEMCQEGECKLINPPEEEEPTEEEPDLGFDDDDELDEEDKEDLSDAQDDLSETSTVWYINEDTECTSFEIIESLADLYFQSEKECKEVSGEDGDDDNGEMTITEFMTKYGLIIFITLIISAILIILIRRD